MSTCPACGAVESCHCTYLRRVAHDADLLGRVIDAHAQPADEHQPQTCPCGVCFTWRVNVYAAADLDPEQPPREPETSTMKPTPDDPTATSICDLCGLAMPEPPPQPRTNAPSFNPPSRWPRCTDCAAIVDLAGSSARARACFLAEVLGTDLSADDDAAQDVGRLLKVARDDLGGLAQDALMTPHSHEPTLPNPPGSARRWQHVDVQARQRLHEALVLARADRRPKRCTDGGGCGGCGVRLSMTWHGPVQMTNTTYQGGADRWPLCDDCDRLLTKAGGSALVAEFREYLTAAAFNTAPTMNRNYVVPYAWTVDCRAVDAPGVAEPFGYLTEDDRRKVWAIWPAAAPPDVRDRRARADHAVALVAASTASGPQAAVDLSPVDQR